MKTTRHFPFALSLRRVCFVSSKLMREIVLLHDRSNIAHEEQSNKENIKPDKIEDLQVEYPSFSIADMQDAKE